MLQHLQKGGLVATVVCAEGWPTVVETECSARHYSTVTVRLKESLATVAKHMCVHAVLLPWWQQHVGESWQLGCRM